MMDSKTLQQTLDGLSRRLDKMQNIEERLEKAFQNVKNFRNKMIQKGYSYEMLMEFNKAIQPIEQHFNEIQNNRRKLQRLEEEQREREAAERKKASERKRVLVQAVAEKEMFNMKCRNFSLIEGQPICEVKMDLTFCSRKCPYATTEAYHYTVDGKGNTVAGKKRKKW